jgi:hypothetical protein
MNKHEDDDINDIHMPKMNNSKSGSRLNTNVSGYIVSNSIDQALQLDQRHILVDAQNNLIQGDLVRLGSAEMPY